MNAKMNELFIYKTFANVTESQMGFTCELIAFFENSINLSVRKCNI